MIDLRLLREEYSATKEKILKKDPTFQVDALVDLDQKVRQLKLDVDAVRKEKNDLAKQGAQGLTEELKAKSVALGKQLKEKEELLGHLEKELNSLWLCCPNLPFDDVPLGNKAENKVVRQHGAQQKFSFAPRNHVDLNTELNWFSFDQGTNLAGSGFLVYHDVGVKLTYALVQLMIKNNIKHGFKPVMPPLLINPQGLYNAGNLPKFVGDYYDIPADSLCLIPTAEVSLTNLHAQQIIEEQLLPIRYTAWTSCFRREAGGYGSTERGLIRIHQFEKVELFSICPPEESVQELERMVACAEDILKMLGLHYRISLLAAQDCSFQSAKTYDIEVWLPGQGQYYEVSSCSNCIDFQARRAQIRYRKPQDKKLNLVHTLNASALALPRLIVALMETYQQADGSIKLPEVLQNAMNAWW